MLRKIRALIAVVLVFAFVNGQAMALHSGDGGHFKILCDPKWCLLMQQTVTELMAYPNGQCSTEMVGQICTRTPTGCDCMGMAQNVQGNCDALTTVGPWY